MPELNHLLISHQDGDQVFKLETGGYSIKEGKLAISIQAENVDEEGFPDCAYICIHNHPVVDKIQVGDVFECNGGMFAEDADQPDSIKANAYFTFHAEELYVKWTVIKVDKEIIRFSLAARHDDVDYYDSRAEECPTSGIFDLSLKELSELWIPS
jgi:hypothetical protein